MKRFAITALFLTAAMPAFAQQKQVVSFKVPEIKYTVRRTSLLVTPLTTTCGCGTLRP